MAKLGISKNTKQSAQAKYAKANLTVNKEGSPAFVIEDAANKLITMIGSSFFNEPKYYGDGTKDKNGLSKEAQDVIKTAAAVANSSNPEDLWVISKWAREELHMRTTPNVLAAVGCNINSTKPWARASIPMIAQRADEPLQVFAAYMSLFGKPLPNSLKRGLADALAKKNEWEHVRYSVGGPGVHPSTKDMFLMIAREGDWPVSKELFEYLVNDNIVNPEKTPIAAARKALVDCKDFNSAKELILKARAPWEVVLSQFGNKKEVWEFMIDNNLVGYMALLRNLRNIEDVKISDSHKKIVKDKLVNGAVSSKQLPFRFLAARKNTTQNWTASAIDLAFNESVANVPIIPGKTLVIMDRSGSMNCLVSGKSQMTCKEVAATLGAILAKRMGTDNVTLYAFADRCAEIKFSDADSVMNIVDNINKTYVGGSTYAQLPVLEAIQKGAKFDRMILLSDMQCYTETSRYRRDNQIVYLDQALNEYRNRVNHDVFMHSIDLQSYGTSQLNPKDKKVQLIGGWSESVFNLITTFEGAENGTGIPTIEELRKRYSLIKD